MIAKLILEIKKNMELLGLDIDTHEAFNELFNEESDKRFLVLLKRLNEDLLRQLNTRKAG